MKKQTQKEIWYWMIIGVGILLILTVIYGAKREKSKTETKNNGQKADQETQSKDSQDEKTAKQDGEDDEVTARGGGSENYTKNLSGGQLGRDYLLDNLKLKTTSADSRLVVYLLPENYDTLPKYQLSQDEDKISLSLSDTTNYDITTGQKTYTGPTTLEGEVIKKAVLSQPTGQMSVDISLDKARSIEVNKATNPLRLIIKVY